MWRFFTSWRFRTRSLRITSMGWKFLGITLIVGFAAVNTGNNLLYLVFGFMLSFIITSGILSDLMLRKLELVRTFPRHLFADHPCQVSVAISNKKRSLSSYALFLEDLSFPTPAEHSGYLLKIPANETRALTYSCIFSRRGVHRPGPLRLSTHYPFGLFIKSATFVETDEELLIYPKIEELRPNDLPNLVNSFGERSTLMPGHSGDIHSIRDYVRGDRNARIHWKSSAKFARLMTKEFEQEHKKKIALFLDTALPPQQMSATVSKNMERAISLAASYVLYCVDQQIPVQLITPGQQSESGTGQRHLFRLLQRLARLQPGNGHHRYRFTRSMQTLKRSDAIKILISVTTPGRSPQLNFAKTIHVR